MAGDYIKMLTDPRWQRKRLEVMQRDDFACVRCEDKESTLNVHHKEYFWNLKPWEYEMEILETLCEACHKKEHQLTIRSLTPEEVVMFSNHPMLYKDPEAMKFINLELDGLNEELRRLESVPDNFDSMLPILSRINELTKRKHLLKKVA